MTPSFRLRTDSTGIYAKELGRGKVGDIETSFTWSSAGGGFTSATFSIAASASYSHPTLVENTRVEVMIGPLMIGKGRIKDVDRTNWRIEVEGDWKRAALFNALGPIPGGETVGPPTTKPATAVEQANLRGLGWNGVGNLPTAALTLDEDDRTPLVSIQQLLDKYCELNNKRWGLSANNTPYVADDPTSPTLLLRPGVPSIPTTSEGYITRVVVRYLDELTVPAAAGDEQQPLKWNQVEAVADDAGDGPEAFEDISDLGLLAATTDVNGYLVADKTTALGIAQNYANKMLAARSRQTSFTAGISEIQPWHLATQGSVSPGLWQPFAGRLLRHYGVHADSGLPEFGRTLEWVVGRSTWRQSDGTATLEPVDAKPRSLPQLVAAAYESTYQPGKTNWRTAKFRP